MVDMARFMAISYYIYMYMLSDVWPTICEKYAKMGLMKFFRTITNSLVSKDFYAELLSNTHPKPVRKAMWYLFRVYIIVALFLTVLISISISAIIPRFDAAAKNILPPGAEIVVDNGVLTTNTNPIVIAMPEDANAPGLRTEAGRGAVISTSSDAEGGIDKVRNLIVLDVTASSTVEALEQKDTLTLITSDGFIFRGDGGRYTIGKFANIKDLEVAIDEEWLVSKVQWLKGFAKFVPFVAFFFILAGLYAASLLACVFYALIILLIMKIQKKDHPFSTAYVVALYSRTFALAIGLLAYIIPFFGINTLSIALQLIFIAFMLKSRSGIIATEDDAHEIKA